MHAVVYNMALSFQESPSPKFCIDFNSTFFRAQGSVPLKFLYFIPLVIRCENFKY
jgi:hypothetical protein